MRSYEEEDDGCEAGVEDCGGGLRMETGGGWAVRGMRGIGCPLEPVGRCAALLTDVRRHRIP